MSEDDNIWLCPRCGSRQHCKHLVAFYDSGCAWPGGAGSGPIEATGAISHEAMVELDSTFVALLAQLFLDDPDTCPSAEVLRRDLGLPDRLHEVIEAEFEASELDVYEPDDPVDLLHVIRDGGVALPVWESYYEDILWLAGARQVTHHALTIPLHSSCYTAHWAADAKACAERVAKQLRADARDLRLAAARLLAQRKRSAS